MPFPPPFQQQRPRPSCRLLLVDDHADTRDVLERLLARRYDVATASCYESALESAAAHAPDVVVTDLGLPGGGDGISLMRELRARHGVTGIAVTGHHVDPQTLRDAGFADYLQKPIRFEELLAALDKACAVEMK